MAGGGVEAGVRAGGDYRPSDPGHAADRRGEVVGHRGVRGVARRGGGAEAGAGRDRRGTVRADEGIGCDGGEAFRVERGATAVRCVSHGDVSAVAETAHHQIRPEGVDVDFRSGSGCDPRV